MTELPNFNHDAFNQVEEYLRAIGKEPLNPARIDGGSTHKERSFYMRKAIELLMQSNQVHCISGWRDSKGARLEVAIAHELEIPVEDWQGFRILGNESSGQPIEPRKEESICQEADRLVSDDRMEDYGHPKDDFDRQAALWTALFSDILAPNCKFNAADIPKAMILVKLSRLMNGYKRDSATDIAGYAKTLDMVETHEDEQ